jgi:hypothetical protein
VNADTDNEVRSLVAGETLIVGSLGYSYNIIAYTQATGMSFVQFYVNGNFVKKETQAPYALCGDNTGGDYNACTSANFGSAGYGTITLEAIAFKGSIEEYSISITFTIKQSARRLGQNIGAPIWRSHNIERGKDGALV